MMSSDFVHLHLHTEFSLIDGMVQIDPLVEKAITQNIKALAITDQSNLFGMVKLYTSAMAKGIKPILGAEVSIKSSTDENKPYALVLLCQNEKGYKNLTLLLSEGYIKGQHHGKPVLEKEWFQGKTEGLIALSGGVSGDIGQHLLMKKREEAIQSLDLWLSYFPDRFYLELQRTSRSYEEEYIALALDLAEEYAVPVVATNDVRFLNREDFEAHETRVCIHDGVVLEDPKRPKKYSEEQYLKSSEEMVELFSDIPEAITNAIEIAKRCNLVLTLGKNFLPDFPVPKGMTTESYLVEMSKKGLEQRLLSLFLEPSERKEKGLIYYDRLAIELDVISKMGFAGYFLIVADFIQWAKQNGIPVGPGRGSGAGSLVAYSLSITDLDPLQYDLLFERFLNPERVSMPDFDIDFCMEGRDRVIEYVASQYGRDSVSQIITFGTMAAKAVVRDVGRVLNHPYGFVDKIAKLIPFEIGMTLEKALSDGPLKERYETEDDVRTLIDLARKLEGVARNAGKHAGGVVISPGLLTDFVPLYCEEGTDHYVTQLDKDDIEAIGLVKFDFLGLRTLTIIDWAVKNIRQSPARSLEEKNIDIAKLKMNDEATYELLQRCQTTAVFQLESRGMKDLIKRLQPDCFEDIIALVALFRPGPLQSGMVDDFINRKHGRTKVLYPHSLLEPVLKPTYGVIVYQEQVMQIAQVLAGYSLGAADILRRAMGKKKPEEMAKQREIFVAGAKANQIESRVAESIFDLMEKFAGYGFNKSHSAAYALLAYQTAYLKAHFPAEFMAAVLSSDMDNTDKVVVFVEECQSMKLTILPPSINDGQYPFTVNKEAQIVYGLGAIKGVGEAALSDIIKERDQNGPFRNLYDFCCRVDLRKVTKRVLEALIKSGAMDQFGLNRASLMASLPITLRAAGQREEADEKNQTDLFSITSSDEDHLAPALLDVPEWEPLLRLQYEKEALGYYLSGHPFEQYRQEISRFIPNQLRDLQRQVGSTSWLAGMVIGVRTMKTKRGQTIAFVTLDDHTGRVDVAFFSEIYDSSRLLLQKDHVLLVEGEVAHDDYTGGIRVSAKRALPLAKAREEFAKKIFLSLGSSDINVDLLAELKALFDANRGTVPVEIEYFHEDAKLKLPLPSSCRLKLTEQLLTRLTDLLPADSIVIDY